MKANPEKVKAWKARSKGLKAKTGFKRPTTGHRKPAKRRKKSDLQKLKAQLWTLCREIIIKRHGNTCYCCGAMELVGSNLHIGHFIASSVCSVELRYSLTNLRPSCYRCNIHLSGNWLAYERHLKADGIDVEELKDHNEKTKNLQYDRLWYEAKISEYQSL